VLLAYAGGHTAREIADRLGIPAGTAKSRLRLGLRRISRLLAEDGLLDES
jgi:RNA polymerase sigma-70 factor (ECF subfamily)